MRVLAERQLLSAGIADALDTYVVRHLGTLMAFSSMLPAVFAAPGATGKSVDLRGLLTPPPW